MAATLRSARTAELYPTAKKWAHADTTSPERTRVWAQPASSRPKLERRVPVVYYLSRNGQLEHPHFMEVPLSAPEGLYLRDVINRLNLLRGKGMALLYSWSAKRSYKNGFVWQDLSENDFIYPAHGHEYVLKGSELMDGESEELGFSGRPQLLPEFRKSSVDREITITETRRNQSWSSSDFTEYKVYKTESGGESTGRAADAWTQTEDKHRRRRPVRVVAQEDGDVKDKEPEKKNNPVESQSTELSRGEISPPPSDSSPETLETLMKADGRLNLRPETVTEDPIPGKGKQKSSSVLLQLLSCGSFRDCGGRDHGFSLISHYKARLPSGNQVEKDAQSSTVEFPSVKLNLEDKEYFSGSLLIEKKDVFPGLKRSSSYNADRSTKMELDQTEDDGKCEGKKHSRKAKDPSGLRRRMQEK
ncbi:unnamed protein product [Cuscuta epithymum]|uniref:SOSEKI DIX-like domain-containing protein n=1 Tax=Cuscuta epithymum TaxID=186058 RepID=A0AAV0F4G9_9ASTE|nr:unnamed protein product [Cuscuta epithymum]